MKKYIILFIAIFFVHKFCLLTKPFGNILDDVEFSQILYDRNGKLLRLTLTEDDKYRFYTKLDKIDPSVKKGTLLFEDRYFYYHFGVNPFSLVRAFWQTYITQDRTIGASTVSMQLSRKLYNINSRTIAGKIHQIIRAVQIEFLYTKDEILEAYLNLAPYGFNIEGVGAASQIYFQKNADRLSLMEGLTLSVIPQSPYKRTHNIAREKQVNDELKEARGVLLNIWRNNYPTDFIDVELDMLAPQHLPFYAPHFFDDLLKDNNSSVIKTTIDYPIQKTFEKIIKNYINSNKHKGIKNASVLLVDSSNMEVIASIGSADFFSDEIFGQVNGVTARRSPGSALKPFAYALAVEQGVIHPESMLKDTKTPFGTYTPDNFDREFSGPLSATEALIHSRNIPAIYIASQIKSPSLHGLLKNAGIPLNNNSDYYGLSIVLGTAEVTMEEMAELYAMLVNGGKYRKLKKLKNDDIKKEKQLLPPEASFLTLNMLAQNPPLGLEQKWMVNSNPVAWKTGTSVGYRDAWAIGIVGKYIIAVWVGNFSGEGNPSFVGRKASAPLLFELVDTLQKIKEVKPFSLKPKYDLNIKKVKVCAISGNLPNENCSHTKDTWFIPTVSPITKCKIHREIEVEPVSGLQVCPMFKGERKKQVFEFWPSDLLKLFKTAGIGRVAPPKLHPMCHKESFGNIAPTIISPKDGITYIIRSKDTGKNTIPLTAIADGNVEELSWYIDNDYIGITNIHEPLLWKAESGKHFIQVMDDQGRWGRSVIQVKLID